MKQDRGPQRPYAHYVQYYTQQTNILSDYKYIGRIK